MRQNVVCRISGYLIPVNCDGSEALVAAANCMRIVIWVCGKVPFQYCTAPVTRSADNQRSDMPCEIDCKISRRTHPLFGEIEIFFREGIVHRSESVSYTHLRAHETDS